MQWEPVLRTYFALLLAQHRNSSQGLCLRLAINFMGVLSDGRDSTRISLKHHPSLKELRNAALHNVPIFLCVHREVLGSNQTEFSTIRPGTVLR